MSLPSAMGSALPRPNESILGIGYSLLISSEQTGGAYELMRFVVPAGAGAPPHVHTREDEMFYVVEGELEVLYGDTGRRIKAGDYAHLPRGTQHGFRNASSSTASFLCWVVPGNLGGFFDAFKRDWPAEQETPMPPDGEDISKLMKAAVKYGLEIRT